MHHHRVALLLGSLVVAGACRSSTSAVVTVADAAAGVDAAARVDAVAMVDAAPVVEVSPVVDAAPVVDALDAIDAVASQADAAARDAAGTIVPLYTDPGDPSWTAIVAAQRAHPRVHIVAIVNPNSGPGSTKNNAYTNGIETLIAAKIQVIGYIATGYAGHSLASMEALIDQWRTFYPAIEGIFFDEQSSDAKDVAYYRTLSQYAKAHGLPYTVGNPGADPDETYVGALDTMLINESKGLPALSKLGGWHTKYAPTSFGIIPYGAALDVAFVRAARADVGYIYVQSDDLPNPWDSLPAFFGDLLAELE